MWTIIAAVMSGALWFGGTGLHPISALTWLAPLPLLLIAPRVRPRTMLAAVTAAWLVGQLNVISYYHGTLQLPLALVGGVMAFGAGLAAGTVLGARFLLVRGRVMTAVLVAPALWVLGEYAVSRLLPNGAWWSLAYTQASVRPVIQLTALTGVWGVTYLLLAAPIALAAVSTFPRPAAACLLAFALAVATWSAVATTSPTARSQPLGSVGLVALEQPDDGMPIDQPEGRELLLRYAARAIGLAGRGARTIVLPEKVFGVSDATLPQLVDAFRPVGARVVVGAVLRKHNVALVVEPSGALTTYEKQHLIPGLEEWLLPGRDDLIVGGQDGVAICKDLDFPGLVRRYRSKGATTLLVPALDFRGDGWLHSRMALVRGVENGMTVVRAAGFGRLTVSDPTGRVLGEATAGDAELLVTVSPAARATLYSRAGDWFLILLVVLVVSSGSRLWWGRAKAARTSATRPSRVPSC
ncbi:nitrilase-related carbon-nitrogen hydrolase [Actinoplanes cyaneus]|uniref:nitrilase-related carbon-nitrogen hydrolase n=1 Tax=Actinoplanes cyaneus TaxID=52696 RepID=UPI0019433F5E|nr:nitrilase-related carbon-nitrogen hydrolase [Actinoplanes cyaneus]MCW2142988.1 Apolipoprotein N-acyltransferase [Actinoplanes cyaneus]